MGRCQGHLDKPRDDARDSKINAQTVRENDEITPEPCTETSNFPLSMARVTIAHWENECISLSVHPMARVKIAHWENECISLSILVAAQVQFPTAAEYFKAFFDGNSS